MELYYACRTNDVDIARLAASKYSHTGYHRCPLYYACKKGHGDMIDFLASINYTHSKDSAIATCIDRGHYELAEKLLDKGYPVDVTTTNIYGNAVVMVCSQIYTGKHDHKAKVADTPQLQDIRIRLLHRLLSMVANINAVYGQGQTLLHHAAYEGLPDIVSILLDKGADINQKDEHNQTAMDAAKQQHERSAYSLTLFKGSKDKASVAKATKRMAASVAVQAVLAARA